MLKKSDYKKLLAIARTPVKSSNVAARAYSETLRAIVMEFHSGDVYAYVDCDKELYERLEAAESQGKFLNAFIKPVKEFIKLT